MVSLAIDRLAVTSTTDVDLTGARPSDGPHSAPRTRAEAAGVTRAFDAVRVEQLHSTSGQSVAGGEALRSGEKEPCNEEPTAEARNVWWRVWAAIDDGASTCGPAWLGWWPTTGSGRWGHGVALARY